MMEYVQERVATLHAFGDTTPEAPVEEAAVVVPMTEREHATPAAERVLAGLEAVHPERVVVALRADGGRVDAIDDWLAGFDLPMETLWCSAPAVRALLEDAGLDGRGGKGRDVWLALGVASAASEYVVVHDADAKTYSTAHVPRLLFPLAQGFRFSKGYYARVEDGRLYGRLFRLFYRPLVRALSDRRDAPILDYLDAFRYALAGEFAATRELAREFRPQPGWGLEVATLGDAFANAGFAGTAQVDLGIHEHGHRSVDGPMGLSDMSREVGAALFRVVEDHGVTPGYDSLPDRYRGTAERLVRQYAVDAAFNGLAYDTDGEYDQIAAYADAVAPPSGDGRLPAWTDAPIDADAVLEAARRPRAGHDG